MIAFFMTIPTTRMHAMAAMMVNCVRDKDSARSAPNEADGSVERIVNG